MKRYIPVHSVGSEVAELAGAIGGELASRGLSIPLDDLLIGASALNQGYAVATLNERHFRRIPALVIASL